MRLLGWRWLMALGLLWVQAGAARAQTSELPRSLVREALSEYRPVVFSPVDFEVEDFELRELAPGPAAAGLTLSFVRGSFEWVRVAKVSLVPRAVVRVRAKAIASGQVRYAGFAHPLQVRDGIGQVDVPVALLGSSEATIEVETRGPEGRSIARFAVGFAPRPQHRGRVLFDSSCSPSGLRVQEGSIPPASFLYIGCRQVRTRHADSVPGTLELYAIWDGVAGQVEIDQVPTAPRVDALYTLRLAPRPGVVRLRAGSSTLVLRHSTPEHIASAFIGFGLGPYLYRHEQNERAFDAMLPVLTLYAGYTFSLTTRVVYFNAIIPDVYGSIDQGLYLWLEQARFLDERMSFNLLLGGNVLIYAHDDTATARFSLPQGFEIVIRDLFIRGLNLTGGAFLYPELEGRAYYNAWLRLGSAQFFGELNFIEWQETRGSVVTRSRVLGVSFGAPLFRLF